MLEIEDTIGEQLAILADCFSNWRMLVAIVFIIAAGTNDMRNWFSSDKYNPENISKSLTFSVRIN